MSRTLEKFKTIRDAEDYFKFFELDCDSRILNVNRLHILRKFSEVIQEVDATAETLTEAEILDRYRQGLEAAYALFLTSNSLEQKLFAVFQQDRGDVVLLDEIAVSDEQQAS